MAPKRKYSLNEAIARRYKKNKYNHKRNRNNRRFNVIAHKNSRKKIRTVGARKQKSLKAGTGRFRYDAANYVTSTLSSTAGRLGVVSFERENIHNDLFTCYDEGLLRAVQAYSANVDTTAVTYWNAATQSNVLQWDVGTLSLLPKIPCLHHSIVFDISSLTNHGLWLEMFHLKCKKDMLDGELNDIRDNSDDYVGKMQSTVEVNPADMAYQITDTTIGYDYRKSTYFTNNLKILKYEKHYMEAGGQLRLRVNIAKRTINPVNLQNYYMNNATPITAPPTSRGIYIMKGMEVIWFRVHGIPGRVPTTTDCTYTSAEVAIIGYETKSYGMPIFPKPANVYGSTIPALSTTEPANIVAEDGDVIAAPANI